MRTAADIKDLVQLFAGRRLRVERNHFGVYRAGGAQLYLTNSVDNATIVNNVFIGTDPRLPGYHARMGIIVGSAASKRLPRYAKIVNNTILTGARRRDGYAGSIRMSSRYGSVKHGRRPIVANNVLGLLKKRAHICSAAQLFVHNVVIDGTRLLGVGPCRSGRPRRTRSATAHVVGRRRRPAPLRAQEGLDRTPARRRARHRRARVPLRPRRGSHSARYHASVLWRAGSTRNGNASTASPSSARMTCTTALIRARCVNACGKLPRWRPLRGSISSA